MTARLAVALAFAATSSAMLAGLCAAPAQAAPACSIVEQAVIVGEPEPTPGYYGELLAYGASTIKNSTRSWQFATVSYINVDPDSRIVLGSGEYTGIIPPRGSRTLTYTGILKDDLFRGRHAQILKVKCAREKDVGPQVMTGHFHSESTERIESSYWSTKYAGLPESVYLSIPNTSPWPITTDHNIHVAIRNQAGALLGGCRAHVDDETPAGLVALTSVPVAKDEGDYAFLGTCPYWPEYQLLPTIGTSRP